MLLTPGHIEVDECMSSLKSSEVWAVQTTGPAAVYDLGLYDIHRLHWPLDYFESFSQTLLLPIAAQNH